MVGAMTTDTLGKLLDAAVAADPARPLLTWYDDATGERTELSGATLANWVAKTANLLVDGAGLAPGDTAAVLLPPHWQTAAILLGCWTAGVSVVDGPAADVAFGTGDAGDAPERYATALHPLALPMRALPAGWSDYTVEVRSHGDHFRPYQPVTGADRALGGRSHAETVAAATARAAELGIAPGTRVLIDVDAHPDPLDWLLAPLTAGATTVACAHPNPPLLPARATTERATPLR
jgi:uncharacterized protein (TIGR03089 family)